MGENEKKEVLTFKEEEEEKVLQEVGCKDLIELMRCKNCKHLVEQYGKFCCAMKPNGKIILNPDGTKKYDELEPTELERSCAYFDDGENGFNTQQRKIFSNIKLILREYLDMKEDYYTLIALWIMGTWMHKSFITYPYLFINAMRGTAKTRTLKLIAALENEGEYVMSLTEAVMFRQNNPLGIDEFENVGLKDKSALRELLNAAYKKGGKVKRVKKLNTINGEIKWDIGGTSAGANPPANHKSR